jgi:two-component system, NtrC family, response regulator AtoC
VFLDEIGEMDLTMQAKLLRVLQERKVRRVGGALDIPIDVRIVAATNRNLQKRIQEGSFREDLFYRLNVFPIQVPPLRERVDDIDPLGSFFLDEFSCSFGRHFSGISAEAAELMKRYAWPGNIRELRNVIERICIMQSGPLLLPEHLPQEIKGMAEHGAAGIEPALRGLLPGAGLEEAVARYEQALISDALAQAGGNVQQTAQILKIPRGTLRYKMEKYQL